MGPCQAPWHRARQRCQSFRASHCRLAQVCCPAAWQGCPEAPRGPKGGHGCTFPIILEESQLPPLAFLLLSSNPSLPQGWTCDASQLRFWVSWGSAPLGPQPLSLLLLPGVVNCSAFVTVTSVFTSSPSSLLLPPGSWKLTSCLSDVFAEPGPSSPRRGDEGPGSRAPPCLRSICPHVLTLAGPCLFLLAWVKGPSVRLATCLVLWKGLGPLRA